MISIQNVKKVFTLDKNLITAVDSLSLEIKEGEIFGVIGYSGAGKSTLVRLLNRLEEPTDGSIIIDGKEMTKLKGKNLRQAICHIPSAVVYGLLWACPCCRWSRVGEEDY